MRGAEIVRLKEAFPVPASTLQRSSDCYKEAAQSPLEEISILMGRSRDSEPEARSRLRSPKAKSINFPNSS